MSKQGIMPSQTTIEALRDFAFAYYSEHEGPSESEHKARDLAQALDGDLSRAAQAAPEPIGLCMCGHCESWSDDGDGMGWCCEHHTMTVSGETCKYARPKAEYAEPAGEAEAPIPEPPPPEGECAEVRWPYEMPEGAAPSSVDEVLRACNERWLSQGDYGRDEEGDWGRHAACLVALAADRARLERECAEWRADRVALLKEIEELRERVAIAEANAEERDRCAQIFERLYCNVRESRRFWQEAEAKKSQRLLEAESRFSQWTPRRETLEAFAAWLDCLHMNEHLCGIIHATEPLTKRLQRAIDDEFLSYDSRLRPEESLQERAEQAEARALEAEKKLEGCFPLPDAPRNVPQHYTPLSGEIGLNAKDLGIPAEWLAPAIADMPQRQGKL